MNILNALKQHNQKLDTERVIIDGLLSICDEVFKLALWELGVEHDIISERLREPVENREAVLKMYEKGIR